MEFKSVWLCSCSEHEKAHGVDPRSKHVDLNTKAELFCRDITGVDATLGVEVGVDAAICLIKCAPHQIVCATTQFSSSERKQIQFWRQVYALEESNEDSIDFCSMLVLEVQRLPQPTPLRLPGLSIIPEHFSAGRHRNSQFQAQSPHVFPWDVALFMFTPQAAKSLNVLRD
eukprot:5527222-Amphidinium_carterae.2